PEMICGHGAIAGRAVALIANSRGVIKGKKGERPKIGGIIYTESAEKVAYFIENADRERIPLLFVQDVSGFMVGTEAEHSGIIRAGARFADAGGFVEASVPPDETRDTLAFLLGITAQFAGPHLGAFVLPGDPGARPGASPSCRSSAPRAAAPRPGPPRPRPRRPGLPP